jgi:ankyrin repeat protein
MRWVLAGVAFVLSGCGGVFFGIDPIPSDAREFPILRAAMDCDIAELRRRAATEHATRDSNGLTAMQWVFTRECDEGVMLLLEAGANPNAPDAVTRWPPLMAAASSGKVRLVNAMVDRGADVNGRWMRSMTPLHIAASNGAADVVRFLLSRGADAQATDAGGVTALHMGARHGEIVRMLLEAGLGRDARTENGATPLGFAHRWWSMPKQAVSHGAQVLLQAGADPNASDANGYTPLMNAARACDEEAVDHLLRAGANVNAVTIAGVSALRLLNTDQSQSRAFGQWVWSLLDPTIKAGVECRDRMRQKLIDAGAK